MVTAVMGVDAPFTHFFLEAVADPIATLLRRDLTEDRLLEERHAIGIEPPAPARVSEVRADDADREGLNEAAQGRILGKLGLRNDGLAGRQQPEGLVVHQADLVIQHEGHELPRAFLVAAAFERGERLGEIKGRALLGRSDRHRQRREFVGADVLLLLSGRARIVLIHAGDAASEGLDNLDEAVGRGAGRRDLVLERKLHVPRERVHGFFRVDRELAVLEHRGAVGIGKLARIEHRPGTRAAHAVAVLILVRLGEGLGNREELIPGPVRCRLLKAEFLQTVGPVVDAVEGDGEGKREYLVVDRHGRPGGVLHVAVMLP
jgi:hypothetical protein